MDRDRILERITALLADIVDDPDLKLTDASKADDFPWWDSLTSLKLIVALEDELHVSFDLADINAPNHVGELISLVQSKL